MYKLQDYSSKVKILNYLIFLFPLAFILGNLAINSFGVPNWDYRSNNL